MDLCTCQFAVLVTVLSKAIKCVAIINSAMVSHHGKLLQFLRLVIKQIISKFQMHFIYPYSGNWLTDDSSLLGFWNLKINKLLSVDFLSSVHHILGMLDNSVAYLRGIGPCPLAHFFTIGKNRKTWFVLPLCKHFSGQRKFAPLFEILNTPLLGMHSWAVAPYIGSTKFCSPIMTYSAFHQRGISCLATNV